MKTLVIGVVASLAALFLAPIVLRVGKTLAKQFKNIQEEENNNDRTPD